MKNIPPVKKLESILDSCILDKQIFTTIDWIYRLGIPEAIENLLLNKAQEKLDQLGSYNEII